MNIIQVTDDFYNEEESLNDKNLKFRQVVCNADASSKNKTAFDHNKNKFDFDRYSLRQIQQAFLKFTKDKERFEISHQLLEGYLHGELAVKAEKEK